MRPSNRRGSTPEQFRRWYTANRERRLAYMAEWRRNNKVLIAAIAARRKAGQVGAVGVATAEQIQARIDFYGGRCWICHKPWEQLDHVIPWARGGSNWLANIRPACASCNARKSWRSPHDLARPSKRGHVVKAAA